MNELKKYDKNQTKLVRNVCNLKKYHKNKNNEKFECKFCIYAFRREWDLKQHFMIID